MRLIPIKRHKVIRDFTKNYLVYILKRGTGFFDGKKRIVQIFNTIDSKNERIRRIKREFGVGGANWASKSCSCLTGYSTNEKRINT